MSQPVITMYAAEWCPDCKRAADWLVEHDFVFEKILVDDNPEAAGVVEAANDGKRVVPTLDIDGTMLSDPSEEELAAALLEERDAAPRRLDCDCLVVGGGPAGLTAAIYLARERKCVRVLEQASCGGQILTTNSVDNYPGFPDGVSGPDLTEKLVRQAEKFGTEIVTGVTVTGLRVDGPARVLDTSKGEYAAPSVILACGSEYRTIDVPGSKELQGRGISYCATCDAPFFKGARVAVVGGGNTAVEEAAFLTGFVDHITVIHRRDHLTAEQILVDELMEHEEMLDFRWKSEVVSFEGEQKLERIRIRDVESGAEDAVEAEGVFVFIGRVPNTGFLRGMVDMDEKGFIVTPSRCGLETNVPGVFAAGDCIGGSHAQLTTAASDGTVASFFVREYLKRHGR